MGSHSNYYTMDLVNTLKLEIMKYKRHLVELKSVGSFVDVINSIIYPANKDGTPDLNCPTALTFDNDEFLDDSSEWWDAMSEEDNTLLWSTMLKAAKKC